MITKLVIRKAMKLKSSGLYREIDKRDVEKMESIWENLKMKTIHSPWLVRKIYLQNYQSNSTYTAQLL